MSPESSLVRGIGMNIAAHRRAAKVTQQELASRIGKSVQWVSAVEQGRRHAERLTDLLRIAQAVRCQIEDLISRPLDNHSLRQRPSGDAVAAVGEAIMRAAVPTSLPQATESNIGKRVAEAWKIWHSSPFAHTILGDLLPSLIIDATAIRHGAGDRRTVAQNLAGAYQIARQWLHHLPDAGLAWIAADRAMNAAREADDPHLIAMGAWALSAFYRRAGQQDEATRLCLAAADEVKACINQTDPNSKLIADYGMLHLAASISAAQSDEDGRAWALHEVAEQATRATEKYCDPWTAFCPTNVDIHRLAISAELGRSDNVVQYSSRLKFDGIPSVERRAAALINMARGFVRQGEDEPAILRLIDAEKHSYEEVRDSTVVRELLRELIFRDRARVRTLVHDLARRSGLIAVN